MISKTIRTISSNVPKVKHEYVGEDGLLHCAMCGEPTQYRVKRWNGLIVPCICRCVREEQARLAEEHRKTEREACRKICFGSSIMGDWTFEKDDKANPMVTSVAENYAEKFDQFRRMGKGLLFYGGVGTGKSYLAACIANRLIDKGYRVRMTNFPTIVNDLQRNFGGRGDYIGNLNCYDLLVLDDIGAERTSEYMQEVVFEVIENRCDANLPMVVTTNISRNKLISPSSESEERIYDRLLKCCMPIEVCGKSRRRQELREIAPTLKQMLGM